MKTKRKALYGWASYLALIGALVVCVMWPANDFYQGKGIGVMVGGIAILLMLIVVNYRKLRKGGQSFSVSLKSAFQNVGEGLRFTWKAKKHKRR